MAATGRTASFFITTHAGNYTANYTFNPLPKAGAPERFDYEYERNGVSNLFMLPAPLEGWRYVKVTDRHTKQDEAQLIKDLVDDHYPDKKSFWWWII